MGRTEGLPYSRRKYRQRTLFFYTCTQADHFGVSDVPEEERGFLSKLPAEGYLRKIISSGEFDVLYKKVSSARKRVLHLRGSLWAMGEEHSFDFEDLPALNSIINGNFVDLIWENMQFMRNRR